MKWSLCDDRVGALTRELDDLLEQEPFKSDVRRLNRLYVGFARLLRPQMDAGMTQILDLLEVWQRTGQYPPELKELARDFDEEGFRMRMDEATRNYAANHIHEFLENCTRPYGTISGDFETMPIEWLAALGIPFDEIKRAVLREYPELENRVPW